MKINYYRSGSKIHAITDQSPEDFKGALFIGKTLIGDTVSEAVFTPDEIQQMQLIDKATLPAVWIVAFGYEAPKVEKPKAEKKRKPKQEKVVVVDVAFPFEVSAHKRAGCFLAWALVTIAFYIWIKITLFS